MKLYKKNGIYKPLFNLCLLFVIALGLISFTGCGGSGGSGGGGTTTSGDTQETQTPLSDAFWSLSESVEKTTVTWVDSEGEIVQSEAAPGQIQIIVDPDQVSSDSVESLVAENEGTIISQLPALGLYWVEVEEGAEGTFIFAVQDSVTNAFPNMIVESRYLVLPTNYTYTSDNTSPLSVSTGNLVIDNFTEPLCLTADCDTNPLYVLKNSDGTVALDGNGNFIETTDSASAASHGDIVNYYRTNEYGLTESTLGSNSEVDILSEAPGSDSLIGIAAMIQGCNDISERPVINVSWGPWEYSGDTADESYNAGWEGYNNSNNANYLQSLSAVLNSNIEGTDEAVIVWAAGNASTDITSILVNELSIHPTEAKQIITVGALDSSGNIAQYSNYSTTLDTMIYVPVTGSTDNGTPIEGTSFAAPKIQYLIWQILESRPDLTPEQLREVLFDSRVAPVSTVQNPSDAGETIEIQVIENPYDSDVLNTAIEVADELFPIEEPTSPTTGDTEGLSLSTTELTIPGQICFDDPCEVSSTVVVSSSTSWTGGSCFDPVAEFSRGISICPSSGGPGDTTITVSTMVYGESTPDRYDELLTRYCGYVGFENENYDADRLYVWVELPYYTGE